MPHHSLFNFNFGHSHHGGTINHHPHHMHNHIRHHGGGRAFQYFPFLFYGSPFFCRRQILEEAPPTTPANTVVSLNATDGQIQQLYYVPTEAVDFLDLPELRQFQQEINQLMKQTAPMQIIMLIITIFCIMIGVMVWVIVEEPFDSFEMGLNIIFGTCFGIFASQFLIRRYVHSYLNFRKKKMNEFVDRYNQQVYLARGCHWEVHVPAHNYLVIYFFLIKHPSSVFHITPSAPPALAEAVVLPHSNVPIAQAYTDHDIEQPSAPLLHSNY